MIFFAQRRGSVCWFRHCCRNHFYLFTASASHDEAAFCPQWGWAPSIRVSAKKFPNVKEKYWEKSEKCKFSEPPHGWRGCGVPGNYCWKCFAFEHFPNMFFKDTYVTFSLCESKILKMTWLIYTQFFSMVIHKYYQFHCMFVTFFWWSSKDLIVKTLFKSIEKSQKIWD